MSDPAADAERLAAVVRGYRYAFADEAELQDGVAAALARAGVPFRREHVLAGVGRIDFLAGPGIGLEVKVGGSLTDLTRQVHRYAAHPDVAALVVVTSRLRLGYLPATLGGKPVRVVALLASAF